MSKQVFPSSFGQQRLWFLNQVTPGTAAYNLARAFRLSGELKPSALEQALQATIARHESLRTVFLAEGDQVRQVVLPASTTFELTLSDLSDLPAGEREKAALRIAGEEAGHPFDLSTGLLLRARLFRLDSKEHILLFVVHHIITDGWSMNLLFHEIGELYSSSISGAPASLPELTLRYTDYARWQREFVSGDLVAGEIDFWKTKLQGAETILRLPTDYPRPAAHSGRGRNVHFVLSHKTNRNLKELAQSENATLFMVLLATFQVLLARYALQDTFLVGTPTAGRGDVELEKVIGFFVDTLILRADVNPESSFRQMLQHTRANTLEALMHQNVPFEKLVEAMEPSRSLNRNPLFQVMFVLQNAPKKPAELPGLAMQEIELESGVAKFDLTLEIIDLGDLYCTLEYDSDLYDEMTIQRMADHFSKLVEAIADAPDAKLAQFSLLSATEVQQFEVWNDTSREYSRHLCVHTAFEDQAARTPEKTAIFENENRLSYRDLNALSNRLARRLLDKGLRPGKLAGISMRRSTEMMIALLGILKTGAAYVPLDPDYPDQRLEFLVEDSRVDLVVTTPELAGLWGKFGITVVIFDAKGLASAAEDTNNLAVSVSAEDRMYVIYTSGSTGTPKGVEGTHRAAMNRFSWMWEAYPFLESETCCQKTSLGFVDSVWEIFGPLVKGIPSVILPTEALLHPEHLIDLLSQHHVTRIVLVPSLLRLILDGVEKPDARMSKLRLWTCSGEPLPHDLVKRFREQLPGATLLNIYGSSEVAADVTWHEVSRSEHSAQAPIGRPINNVKIFLLDRHLNRVPVGVTGEIYVGGDCVAQGYLGKPELTAERFFVHSVDGGASLRLFKTGDLGRYLPSGEIEYLGRTDNQVKIRGIRVELEEIEAVLASYPTIRDAVVVLAERSGQQRLTAYIELRSGLRAEVGDLRRHMRSRLPETMVPTDYVVVDEFLLLPSGKVDRRGLALRTFGHPLTEVDYVAPETATEERLVGIWHTLLSVEKIGITDNFFELGGHSLMVMQVVARIRKEFDVEVSIRSLFDDPTIRGLAREVEDAKAKGLKAAVPISAFVQAQDHRDRFKSSLEALSREELEEILRDVLREKAVGSSN